MSVLEWQRDLFRSGSSWLQRRFARPEGVAYSDHAARLADHRAALTALARAVSGLPLRIETARDAGGVRGIDLLLPPEIGCSPDPEQNRALYVLRVAVGAALCRLAAADREPNAADPKRALARACAWLSRELPHFAPRLAAAQAIAPPDLLFGAHFDVAAAPPVEAETEPAEPGVGEGVTGREAEAPRVGAIEDVRLEQDERGDILWNPFDRVETLDEYRGGWRNLDGADDLDAHLEALSEVELGKVTRGGSPAQSLLRADIRLDSHAPDLAGGAARKGGIPYDEWDFRSHAYRRAWCTVYAERLGAGEQDWASGASGRHRKRIAELRRRLERQRAGLRSVDRQLDGEDIDLAALVDERAAAAAGFGGNPRLYVRREHRRRDFATTVLLDVSLSSDAWIRGRRVFDVSRDAVFVLGEVAAQLGDRLRVVAFASETRHRCRVWEVQGWNEPWSTGRARLGALAPQGYTRIGPAIRHASADLASVSAERKLLLLVSDGKPTDYDRYEGHYGIADVRQALREAERSGLRAHALAIDAIARDWLPALFGPGAWHVLPRPDLLPDVLTAVYGRLTLAAR
jgi:nitric oxide reductase NorD protein